ncbi:MAG TPA: hypothetical protein PKA05_19840, partial [Roseiflexaceae bacterium]|nr:hypothetical protein [Roseiflexaceae bacterium]HMP42641.1 hypothetical protein [Roseiflexaceae bacterium]
MTTGEGRLQRLHALISDLDEIEQELARLQAEREALRAGISEIVAQLGNRVTIEGYGTLALRAPSVSRVWDGRALDDLITSLRETGLDDYADEIAGCKKRVERAGGLAITRQKPAESENPL